MSIGRDLEDNSHEPAGSGTYSWKVNGFFRMRRTLLGRQLDYVKRPHSALRSVLARSAHLAKLRSTMPSLAT